MKKIAESTRLLLRQFRENLLTQFSAVALLVTGAMGLAVALLIADQIERNARQDLVAEAVGTTVDRVMAELTPADLSGPMGAERYRQFDAFVDQAIRSDRTARIKLWAPDGTVIYSDEPAAVGERFPGNENVGTAMGGENAVEIELPTDPENERERYFGTLMEIYTPLVFPGDRQASGVLEIYQYYAPTASRIRQLQIRTIQAVSAGFVLLYVSLVSIVARGWRTITQQRETLDVANQRLLSINEELVAAQERLRLILNTAGEGIFGVDPRGFINFVNPMAASILGWEMDELLGGAHARLLHGPDRRDDRHCPVCLTLGDHRVHHADDLNLSRKDGSRIPVEYTSSPIHKGPTLAGAVVVFSDITERKRAESALRESQRTLATLMSNLPGMAYRGKNDRGRTMQFVSEGGLDLTAYPADALLDSRGVSFADLIHPEDRDTVWNEIQAALRAKRPFQLTYRLRPATGQVKWVWEQGRGVAGHDGSEEGILEGFITDITERVQLQDQLQHDAFHDALTGLPNRALFMDRLRQALQRIKRRPQDGFAVLFLDLDRFKVINDSLGHLEGDQVLIETARRLSETVRDVDTVARLGGDEFALLLTEIEESNQATRVVDRILSALDQEYEIADRKQVFVSASLGLAFGSAEYARAEDVLRDADLAMYRAKSDPKAGYALFDLKMHQQAVDRLEVETDLRVALDRGEFELYYQPIVSIEDGQVAGYEALLRWHHPTRGLLLPTAFLQVAEDSGLMVRLGNWVIREACRQAAAWRESFEGSGAGAVSINLSEAQFSYPDLPGVIRSALHEHGLPPELICLEITEGVAMEATEDPESVLASLLELGVAVHLDDFGTGYSSLATLHRFPIDAIKIDRSLIAPLADVPPQTSFVETVLFLAERLGADVIAEGVEERNQATALAQVGCRWAQGYCYGRPLPADEVPSVGDPVGFPAITISSNDRIA